MVLLQKVEQHWCRFLCIDLLLDVGPSTLVLENL